MSEYVEGLSKEELYRIHLNRVNSDYDRKLEKKSIFTSSNSIEEERKKMLKKIDDDFYPKSNGGCFSDF